MDDARFLINQLNPNIPHEDLGDAFQRFCHELLLPEYPGLHLFASRGKDGGIDLSQSTDSSLKVFECKHIGTDGVEEATNRWKKVEANLSKHLADPDGPTKGQKQYQPWYRTDLPIRKYIFCTSSILKNQGQLNELPKIIINFFSDLSSKYKHLSHLKGLTVEVLDWSDFFTSRLKDNPHLLFRWFPHTRPEGLVPLDESKNIGTFRSYLDSDKVPFYSRSEHLKLCEPAGEDIPDEESLLGHLGDGNMTGLVVTGPGGVGKTRLMFELGRLAREKDWLVLKVQTRLRRAAIDQLVEGLNTETQVLLLVDYIETHKDFFELVDIISDLNATYSYRLRYIATCRSSYYNSLRGIKGLAQVDLSLVGSASTWLKDYQQHTVRHILENSGLIVSDELLAVCNNIPVLAIFTSYLNDISRDTDLAELVESTDFGQWVASRITLSFAQSIDHRHLSILMAILPFSTALIFDDIKGDLLDRLATDGWIDRLSGETSGVNEEWVPTHDALADQVLLSYLKQIPATIDNFVYALFSTAYKYDCLDSVLITLQRLVDQSQVNSLDWPKIFKKGMTENPTMWRGVRDILIRTPLLTPTQVIKLLKGHDEVWEDAEKEIGFQNNLCWIIRTVLDQNMPKLDSEDHAVLESWVHKTAIHANKSNYILTCGLRFFPNESLQSLALKWILEFPRFFQTHFLMVAWLECGLPIEEVAPSVKSWSEKFDSRYNFSFLLKSWLVAGGEKELIEPHLSEWLDEHGAEVYAKFLYSSWLLAGGEKELVEPHLLKWLVEHGTELSAGFIYDPWLDAGGGKELIEPHLSKWLVEHETELSAGFIYNSWLVAGGEKEFIGPHLSRWLVEHGAETAVEYVCSAWLEAGGAFSLVSAAAIDWLKKNYDKKGATYLLKIISKEKNLSSEVIKYILEWCEKFSSDDDAIWRLTQLRNNLSTEVCAEEVCSCSETVLAAIHLRSANLEPVTKQQVNVLLFYLIKASEYYTEYINGRIDTLFLAWLRNPVSYGGSLKPVYTIQRGRYFYKIIELLSSKKLDLVADRSHLERFLEWVNNWDPYNKSALEDNIRFLKRKFPAAGLWDIVNLPVD